MIIFGSPTNTCDRFVARNDVIPSNANLDGSIHVPTRTASSAQLVRTPPHRHQQNVAYQTIRNMADLLSDDQALAWTSILTQENRPKAEMRSIPVRLGDKGCRCGTHSIEQAAD